MYSTSSYNYRLYQDTPIKEKNSNFLPNAYEPSFESRTENNAANILTDGVFSHVTTTLKKEGYELGQFRGKGTSGKVFEAWSNKVNSLVAVKMLDKKKLSRQTERRIRDEALIHTRLEHPTILKVFESFEDRYYVYLILELCEMELEKLVRERNGLSILESQRIFSEIVSGLHYLHHHKIAHRDLKMANILLTKKMHVKIADFGLATWERPSVHGRSTCGTVCGTPRYIAPEVVRGGPYQPLPVDIWSLGCILSAMLTGTSLFHTQPLDNNVALPRDLPSSARDLLRLLLQTDPAKRPSTSQILNHAFLRNQALLKYIKPLCVARLRPITKRVSNRILSIGPLGPNESVVRIEFLSSDSLVCGSFQVSEDGMEVTVQKKACDVYRLESLPEKYHKLYEYARSFVELVRSKTPKVTFYTDKARCMLMETLAHFECKFYESDFKFSLDWREEPGAFFVKVVNRTGITCFQGEVSSVSGVRLPVELERQKDMYPHARENFFASLEMEKKLVELEKEKNFPPLFPAVFSRRRELSVWNHGVQPLSGKQGSRFSQFPLANDFSRSYSTLPPVSCVSQSRDRQRRTFIAGVGWGEMFGAILHLLFLDGHQLTFGSTGKEVTHVAPSGDSQTYQIGLNSIVPPKVKEKLEYVQHFIELLKLEE
ncbi:serine/threonine-protein kinase PLK4-like isoform X2 [Zophobas morio]|uniref:serine/threonine-protein kinase PLK4-like isoform X2 n=1 Tax=Zophobas morio TaxID=2755281 RepID=UPI0030832B67